MSLFQPISIVPLATYFEPCYASLVKVENIILISYVLSIQVTLDQAQPFQKNGAIALLVGVFYLLSRYAIHCTWVTSEAYSSPSIVLAARGAHGNRIIFDDYHEAYYWLTQNSPTDAKVMSWWDYGYQITAMGNRTVIVDNNTWNNTHIATVGRAMSSYKDKA